MERKKKEEDEAKKKASIAAMFVILPCHVSYANFMLDKGLPRCELSFQLSVKNSSPTNLGSVLPRVPRRQREPRALRRRRGDQKLAANAILLTVVRLPPEKTDEDPH